VNNKVELNSSIWDAVHTGMQLAGASYSGVNKLNLKIAAKTGTAQEKKTSPDHAQMISYAPYDNPQVCVAVTIQNGYTSGNAIALSADIYKAYYGIE
jgi:penicillin-binding protein 2